MCHEGYPKRLYNNVFVALFPWVETGVHSVIWQLILPSQVRFMAFEGRAQSKLEPAKENYEHAPSRIPNVPHCAL